MTETVEDWQNVRICRDCPHDVVCHGPFGCSECNCKSEVDTTEMRQDQMNRDSGIKE